MRKAALRSGIGSSRRPRETYWSEWSRWTPFPSQAPDDVPFASLRTFKELEAEAPIVAEVDRPPPVGVPEEPRPSRAVSVGCGYQSG